MISLFLRVFRFPTGPALMNLTLALFSAPLLAAEPPESTSKIDLSRLQTHVLGGWSFGDTDGNVYLGGEEDGNAESANIALNLAFDATERLRFAAQIEAHSAQVGGEGEEVELDFLYATYNFSPELQVRLGRVKHSFGIYSEFFDLGTIRPFVTLAQSIYGSSGMAGESLDGIGFSGSRLLSSGWDLGYDVYYGQLELVTSEPWDLLEADEDELDFDDGEEASELFLEERSRDEVIGGRVTWAHPELPLTFGLSAYTGVVEDQELGEVSGEVRRDTAFAFQVDFTGEKWWIRSEIGTVDQEDEVESTGGYLEAAYFLTPKFQVAVRFDIQESDVLEFEVPEAFDDLSSHEDIALGVAWWFHHSWVAKAAFHQVHGSRYALPEAVIEGDLSAVPSRNTELIELGVQFSF